MNRVLYILILIIIVFEGCKENSSEPQSTSSTFFRIDLQSQFFDDSVRVIVDNTPIFEGTVTTGNALGLAKTISVNTKSGQHKVEVQVVHPYTGTKRDTTIIISDTLTVAVNLDERSRTLYFTLYPFLLPYR